MGMEKKRRDKFYAAHPLCIFCGGTKPIETVEHCPPRALFQNNKFPEGFIFPACKVCNNGSSDQDLLIAMVAKSGWSPLNNTSDDNTVFGLIARSDKRNPDLIKRIVQSAQSELIPKHENGFALIPEPYDPHHQIVISLPIEFDHAMDVFARKLAKGIYYKETKTIFPNDGGLVMQYFTNAEWKTPDEDSVFAIMQAAGGDAPSVVNGNIDLSDQFWYQKAFAPQIGMFVIRANFTATFRLEIFGSSIPGQLEAIVARLEAARGTKSPWRAIQPFSPLT
jgi:hypothetical protein